MFSFILLCIICQTLSIRSETDLLNNFDIYFRNQKPLRSFDEDLINNISFGALQNYEVNAIPVSESQYPWIGRVVHSQTRDIPHVCTATCIDPAIFITASRCIHTLKIRYTSIIYNNEQLPAVAFVLPSKRSKQAFDDIGLIVVDSKSKKNRRSKWSTIELFPSEKRSDHEHSWFLNINDIYTAEFKVVGYAIKKGIHRIVAVDRHYDLTELNVTISKNICHKILTPEISKQFLVPCYYSCSYEEFTHFNNQCTDYHGVEGGAVFDSVSNTLIGIATWGSYYREFELPVGFSFPNTEKFFNDYACAKKIRAHNERQKFEGDFQNLCN